MSNILGENHLPYVQEQIKVRQKVLGKSEKSSQDIVWENGKSSWIRLVSSVNIDGQEVPRYDKETKEDYIEFYFGGALFREKYLELASENYSGNRLASELTLSGGTPLNNQHRFGISETTSTLPGIQNSQGNGNAAYGLGGTEFGIKPMPGITGMNSKTYDNGSLRMAEIQIVAHNKKQFEYLESLYLRVGYTMLLEWGNSSYPKSIENGIATYSSPSDTSSLSLKDDFLEGSDKGVDHFYSKIENNRKISKGNYDGFLGKVTNFSWDFDKNGSYNITLKLITIGSVIESLKLNTNLEKLNLGEIAIDPQDEIINPNRFRPSALGNYLNTVDFYPPQLYQTAPAVQATTAEQVANAITVVDTTFVPAIDPRLNTPDSSDTTNVDLSGGFVPEGIIDDLPEVPAGRQVIIDNFNVEEDQQVIDNLPEDVEEEDQVPTPPVKTETTFNDSTYKGFFDEDSQKALGGYGSNSENIGCRVAFGLQSKETKSYVRLGEFLNFINETLLVYDINGDALISIDVNEDLYCYSNGYQFPSNPSKMIIRFEATLSQTSNRNNINILPKLPKFHDNVNGVKVGKVMNLYFSTDYIREQIELNQEEGKLKLLPFLKKLIESSNSLLGGINKLRVRIKDKITEVEGESKVTQVVEIYDEVQPFEKEKLLVNQTENPILNVYGFSQNLSEGNFVTDYNFSTTIDKDFATQIAIGAQASGRSVGEDATVFSKWNEGLVDRVLPKKLDIDQVKEQGTNARVEFKNLTTEYLNTLKLLVKTSMQDQDLFTWQGKLVLNEVYTIENVYISAPSTDSPTENQQLFQGTFPGLQRSFFTKALSWLALTKNTPTPFIGFLPVNLSLTFDGLSGIKIFDKLRINSDFLPSNYTDTLEFIITQLDHKFENNKWLTTLGTLSIPKLFADQDPSVTFNLGELIEDPFDRKFQSVDIDSYFYSDQPIVTGGNPGKVTIDEILKALNPSLEVQIKFERFFKGILKAIGKGYEIRVNSSYRDFRDSNRVYFGKEPISEKRLDRALKSPHTYGLAIDIALYEPVPGQPGFSTNLLAGKPKEFFDIWQDLGITNLSNDIGLRWGGVFKQAVRDAAGRVTGTKPFYDCVHFDACPSNWVNEASILLSGVKTLFPNIYLVMNYGYKNNFRDFGIGEEIYDSVTLKDYLSIQNGILTPIKPTMIKQGNNAKDVLYKAIFIDGSLEYFDGNDKVNLRNLLTNSTG